MTSIWSLGIVSSIPLVLGILAGVLVVGGLAYWLIVVRRQAPLPAASAGLPPDEEALIRWFLAYLEEFFGAHPGGRLVTFSGTDNDLPWIRERIGRYGLPEAEAAVLERIGHLDLRVAFHKRTQNNQMSLKTLEELFGIERGSQLSSRKVSYLLTDVLSQDGRREIPGRISEYLGEDVHHLLLRFGIVSLIRERKTSLGADAFEIRIADVEQMGRFSERVGFVPGSVQQRRLEQVPAPARALLAEHWRQAAGG